ncbi:MFS general substrate transporter [Hyaloscypha variabilis F]|uniref:MFS general substrate transporter n=1 Tax=Hyaloscypha variabilis (strain UAMH 11265 / GT02V1 / F) TaxID=1149755 RepID=A0A2J6QYX8_HYAVF|nr:MFS general substrate transporter [Hyaloscypha variabilis F]
MATTTVTIDSSTRSGRVSSSIDINNSANTQQHQQQQQQRILPREVSVDVSRLAPPEDDTPSPPADIKPFKPTRRFWLVMLSISTISLCGSVEGTIMVNALPTIVAALGGGNLYLWVPNAFFLASIAVLPLYAQASDIFGRRTLLLGAVSLFVLGCALGGASKSMTMLIIARTIQGTGSGGVDTLTETIILDLVPLRDRAKYLSYVSIGTTVGYVAGPFIGGLIVVRLGWPWVFYLNAILGGAALVMFFFFLRVKHRRGQSFLAKVKRIDFGGNAIFIGAVVAVLLAVTWGGPVYHWDSAKILVPLILGLLGLLAFIAFEWTPRLAPEPSFPRAVVSNRTSAAVLAMTLVNSITMYGTFYFLPVYFQGVLAKSPLDSGIALAPISAAVIPFAVVSGILLSNVGKYRPIHIFGWSAMLVAAGLCSTLNRRSSTAAWACFEILGAAGLGSLSISLLPALQAPLEERYAATSAGMYSFARGFGAIWGVTIPSTIFNNVVRHQVATNERAFATNTTLATRLADGQAYQLATKAFLDSLEPSDSVVREQVIAIFEHAIHVVFCVLVAFAGLGLLLVLLEKEVPMRTENNTEFGLEESKDGNNEGRVGDGDGEVGDVIIAADRSRHSVGSGTMSRAVDVIPLEEVNGIHQ